MVVHHFEQKKLAHQSEKMVQRWYYLIAWHHFLWKCPCFPLELRECVGPRLLDLSHATIGSPTLFFMPPYGIPPRATWEHLFKEIFQLKNGDFGGQDPFVGSFSSTSNFRTWCNFKHYLGSIFENNFERLFFRIVFENGSIEKYIE